jgi:hypothetical protein
MPRVLCLIICADEDAAASVEFARTPAAAGGASSAFMTRGDEASAPWNPRYAAPRENATKQPGVPATASEGYYVAAIVEGRGYEWTLLCTMKPSATHSGVPPKPREIVPPLQSLHLLLPFELQYFLANQLPPHQKKKATRRGKSASLTWILPAWSCILHLLPTLQPTQEQWQSCWCTRPWNCSFQQPHTSIPINLQSYTPNLAPILPRTRPL